MKYIKEFTEGCRVSGVYLCKYRQSAVTKNGKSYDNVILQDKTGTIDAKIWEPDSAGIADFQNLDYVDIVGDVSNFQGALQLSIKRARVCREGEYNPADYLPVSDKDIDTMYAELLKIADSVENRFLKALLNSFFREDREFVRVFCSSSAAKSIHHSFVGGLLEHTLSVAKFCNYLASAYPVIKRDLLITCAILHDIGKVREFSPFPENDYTDDGQLLGHIVMGCEMIGIKIRDIDSFPGSLEAEVKHCILAHHGKLEFGSPKKPALVEAVALSYADDTDAKLQTFTEIINSAQTTDWLGFNRLFESNLRMTQAKE